MSHIGALLVIMWGLIILIGGSVGYMTADGEFRAIGETLAGNQIIGWLFIIGGIESILPKKYSPLNSLIFILTKGIKFIVNRVKGDKV